MNHIKVVLGERERFDKYLKVKDKLEKRAQELMARNGGEIPKSSNQIKREQRALRVASAILRQQGLPEEEIALQAPTQAAKILEQAKALQKKSSSTTTTTDANAVLEAEPVDEEEENRKDKKGGKGKATLTPKSSSDRIFVDAPQ